MLSQQDKEQIQRKGITEEQIQAELKTFQEGFPYLKLKSAAAVGNGILKLNESDIEHYEQVWADYKAKGHRITKFVPASGAASRMFKNLFEFLNADYEVPTTPFEQTFFEKIEHFAFFDALNDACELNEGKSVDELLEEGSYKVIVENLLEEKGLNYGSLPKGLLQFHSYEDCAKTPVEEHLTEAALYASSQGESELHFTVSHEHKELFEELIDRVLPAISEKFKINFHVSLSEQKSSTDTIAANMDNTPFRNADGSLLFRPGGHGALIQNLNDLQSDVVFIKNIDNVVPDRLKSDTVKWKNVIAGILVEAQKTAFRYLQLLDGNNYNHNDLEDIIRFVRHTLGCDYDKLKDMTDEELHTFLRNKLNRPIRVCGMVRNQGEPGGGPFVAYNADGSVSSQILESSQIDPSNKEYQAMFAQGTHFNPVDVVCAIRNYQGEKFNLPEYVDPQTGFISYKSKDGRELKALELPGLWNGAMSNWSTLMVEVPLETFNPVKTVNDLLRPQHQN